MTSTHTPPLSAATVRGVLVAGACTAACAAALAQPAEVGTGLVITAHAVGQVEVERVDPAVDAPTASTARLYRIDATPAAAVSDQPIVASGTEAWLPEFGLVRVFRIVAPNGDTTHWATNDLGMAEDTRRMFAELSWGIEEYHRGLKQFTGVERCQARAERCQRNHIGCAIRAFVRLEYHRFTTGVSWFAAKMGIIREAVRKYLANPVFVLPDGSSA